MRATAEDYRRKAKFIKVKTDMGVDRVRERVKELRQDKERRDREMQKAKREGKPAVDYMGLVRNNTQVDRLLKRMN